MPRTPRIVAPGCPHHIMLRGNNRRRIFSRPSDYLRFLAFLRDALRKVPTCAVHVFSLMSNHVHLVVTPQDAASLSRFVKLLAQAYARYRNARRGGSGKLFEERFRSEVVTSEPYLAVLHAYVELNSTHAGLTRHPSKHRWSSYHLHAGGDRPDWVAQLADVWQPSDWYLSMGPTKKLREKRYAEWIEQCHSHHLAQQSVAITDAVRMPRASSAVLGNTSRDLPTRDTRIRRPNGRRAA